jgi:hypothetical protein
MQNTESSRKILKEFLTSGEKKMKILILGLLGHFGKRENLPLLEIASKDKDTEIAKLAEETKKRMNK